MRRLSFLICGFATSCAIVSASCASKEYPVMETYYDTEYRTQYRTESYTESQRIISTTEGKDYLTPEIKWYSTDLSMEGYSTTWYFGYTLPTHDVSRTEVYFRRDIKQLRGVWRTNMSRYVWAGEEFVVYAYDTSGMEHIPKFSSSWRQPEDFEHHVSWSYTRFGEPYRLDVWCNWVNSQLSEAKPLSEGVYIGGEALSLQTTGVTKLAILVAGVNPVFSPISSAKLIWSDEVIEEQTVTKERLVSYQVPYEVEKQRTVTETRRVPFWEAISGE